ncbi:hypothetical protein HPB50_028133 [Hyalomma asiaticum]|nr:hypothetical protein HPB50_028133 [Hyalomma asiaticum]
MKAVLQQDIRHATCKPDVILVQKTLTNAATLTGYKTHNTKIEERGLCTLVRKRLTFIDHEISRVQMEHALIELIPSKRRKQSIFLLDVYSSPSKRRQGFRELFHKTLKIAGSRSLIAGGDFNAADTAWGYGYSTAKGRQLGQDAQELDFTLITDPAQPMRIGNSTTRDTTPDMTFVRNACPADTTWKNTSADLESDHMIVEVCVSTPDRAQGSKRKFEWTDWEDFRKKRGQQQSSEDTITDIERALRSSRRTAQSRMVETEATATRAFLCCFPGVLRTTRTLAASPFGTVCRRFGAHVSKKIKRKKVGRAVAAAIE